MGNLRVEVASLEEQEEEERKLEANTLMQKTICASRNFALLFHSILFDQFITEQDTTLFIKLNKLQIIMNAVLSILDKFCGLPRILLLVFQVFLEI